MKQRNLAPLAAALFAAMTMGACSDNNDNKRSIGQDGVGANRHQAAQDVKTAAGNAAAKQSDSVNDAAITTTVNAELARDGKLDPTRIDVDTSRGRVALRGTAPDAESRERAKHIALSIKGVTGVDNFLTVSKM